MNLNQVSSNRELRHAAIQPESDWEEIHARTDGSHVAAVQTCRAILSVTVDPCRMSAHAEHYVRQKQDEAMAGQSHWVDECASLTAEAFEASLDAMAASAELPWDAGANTDDVVRFVLMQCAPRELLRGALLQNFCNASNSHEVIASLVHRLHAMQVGDGQIRENSANLYRLLLSQYGLDAPDVLSEKFFAHPDIVASSWDLPAYQLSLSLFPKRFDAELFGAALFDVSETIAKPLTRLAGVSNSPYIQHKRAVRDELNRVVRQVIAHALARQTGDGAPAAAVAYRRRILTGFRTSALCSTAWQHALRTLLDGEYLAPRSAMIRLIERKGIHAVGYHERLKVGEAAFDRLIIDDPSAFVRALERSRWIAPGHPEKSLLITKLIEFGGPMFRVFSDSEIETIRKWITAIPDDTATRTSTSLSIGRSVGGGARFPGRDAPRGVGMHPDATGEAAAARLCARAMYTKLLNNEQDPGTHRDARHFARCWLARSAAGMTRDDSAIPFETYSRDRLRSWFDEKTVAQLRSYAESDRTVQKTREEVVDEALQLCPMIFIDGAWLQKWGNVGLVETQIGSHLFKIYADEIGNGNVDWNHPNIYRNLIGQMGVDLPDFRTPEFAQWPGFRDSAFDVPVFWLSIALFPRTYLAETLGLNLAMELSGVGGSYKTAHDELRHYGFSTLFVDLHNTIDNVSTGHSALALEAIELHMDEAVRTGDARLVAERWRRVWTGYRALTPRARKWAEIFKPAVYAY
ncbi:iron-containing redox enzyme family protein [Burkholderia sp. AU15512]|uniref:iron-containing redox enzyme family protein n=1 Tax=Burkholderia sp. AU15512 TaxID=2015345 RepID=UPI00117E8B83|nr:iron-containing redox enzyme family protein [Burkholderia sp. AU15512]